MTSPLVVIHPDADVLAQAVAARLVTTVVDAQAARGSATVVLTGGGIATATLREVAAAPARDAVDWDHLEVWWGDERFLPDGDAERNLTDARGALFDSVSLPAEHFHPMPASDGPDGDDVDAAAARYAADLAARAADGRGVPVFDIVLLGIGPEGHVASLFPEAPALYDDRSVVAVRSSPKPPPTRISMTLPTINNSREVWVVAAGESKAGAVQLALSGAGPTAVPAAGVSGKVATRWLLDRPAASKLPSSLARPASL